MKQLVILCCDCESKVFFYQQTKRTDLIANLYYLPYDLSVIVVFH